MHARLNAATEPGALDREKLPLVIALDSVLLRSNPVHEAYGSGLNGLFQSPREALGALIRGNRSIREWLTSLSTIDYGALPYEPAVLNLALSARAQHRKVYLATVNSAVHAAAIAAHFGLDGVIALDAQGAVVDTDDPETHKLCQDGFEYVGSDRTTAAWRDVSRADVVGSDRNVTGRQWVAALRVYQYAKNVLVFVPLLTSHHFNLPSFGNAVLAFLAFSACASSAYLLNDILDLPADRHHPIKRNRAIASGALPIASALIAIPCLAVTSLLIATAVSWPFLMTVVTYLVLTIAYSVLLKKMLLVDIIALAGLYTIRILGGAIAIGVHLSEWLLIFSLFVFTSLALIKRYGELTMRQGARLADPVHRDYRIGDLNIVATLAGASGMNAITVFSLYISSPAVTSAYSSPWLLWMLDPLLLYWIGRALMIAHRRGMQDDPIVYTFKDGPSRTTVLLMTCIALAAI
jgi:4-hydroxybenzoate polyprenyltransferase